MPSLPVLLFAVGCGSSEPEAPPAPQPTPPARFRTLEPEQTGVDFANWVPHTHPQMNVIKDVYYYNGAGVAVGDVDGDGLPDLFFAGNIVPDKLYLNRGGLRFEDVTLASGAAPRQGWSTGAAMVDIDADGDLDIHVSRSGRMIEERRANLLLINDGTGRFAEQAARLGLADTGYTTQAAFLDFDRDGDLDVFVLNHPLESMARVPERRILDRIRLRDSPDRLYRNDGGRFTDVSVEAGISGNPAGFGLSVSVGDLDDDGWPDLYVANDFVERDYLYVNQRDGTFAERLEQSIGHTSYFSMGSDIVDVDNDRRLDIVVGDMAGSDNYRAKTMMQSMNVPRFREQIASGYYYQYAFNMLQRNNGDGTFSEVAQLAGIARSDWTWAMLGLDLDNDGWRDLFVTNGRPRSDANVDVLLAKKRLLQEGPLEGRRMDELLRLMPEGLTANLAFRNRGDLSFEEVGKAAGLDLVGASAGVAYADLDGDGDLDLVINNTNGPATIHENLIRDAQPSHFLRVTFAGSAGNPDGIGARVTITSGGRTQLAEHYLVRGYQSSVEPGLHFGTGSAASIDEVTVRWPDGRAQTLTDVAADRVLELDHADAQPPGPAPAAVEPLLTDVTASSGLDFVHRENPFDDLAREILLPYEMSRLGPALAVGDVQGDGLDDVFVGGATGQAGALFVQDADGRFTQLPGPWSEHAAREDVAALFFDADQDGDVDLYVGSGGSEPAPDAPALRDRLYLNDGGRFTDASDRLPDLRASTGAVTAGDLDGDGDLDLFVGGRLVPGRYPLPPRSAVLVNEGGRFVDATATVAPDLASVGLVTDARFADLDGDDDPDLAVVGEWMPLMLAHNDGGTLRPSAVPDSEGWWQSLTVLDADVPSLVAGNVGRSIKFRASVDAPFRVYASDFDDSGSLDIVLAAQSGDTEYPVRGRECSSQQMPFIKDKFPSYDAFGRATLRDVYGDDLDEALALRARTFDSSVWWREGDAWRRRSLPVLAQIGTSSGIVQHDVDGDGIPDLIVAGNLEKTEVETTRIDGGTGLVLLGSADGTYTPVEPVDSGFSARGDVKRIARLRLAGGTGIVIVRNDGPASLFRVARGG